MRQRTLWKLVCLFAQMTALLPGVASAQTNPGRVTITGSAHFEKRTTVIAFVYCGDSANCPKEEPYWSLVVNSSNGVRYELSQPFAMGQNVAPQVLEVSGVAVKDGSKISLKGNVTPAGPGYAIVSEVDTIALLDDDRGSPNVSAMRIPGYRHPRTQAPGGLISPDPNDGATAGWICRNADERDSVDVYAQVWYVPTERPCPGYRLMVNAKKANESSAMVSVASIHQVVVTAHHHTVMFSGQRDDVSAELEIGLIPGRGAGLPARLTINRAQTTGGYDVPLEGEINLTCTQVSVIQ